MTGRQDTPYEASFNPNLPWGYWLVAKGETDGGYSSRSMVQRQSSTILPPKPFWLPNGILSTM